ncbi:SNF2 family DNA or RNA helicase [Fontibacillus solani]|uniref:SNF2 family DNA or RNA helicase n=1 Tax=Fontibacillus solani TaxID=1572857 RepID=A0A7W3SYW4_9BACL|nr:DEAD/DEAH box helicase [Fontibacillus solani]MBA9088786.1 SNF2 family DNA or RNA helicase [Fontibacillus solani]
MGLGKTFLAGEKHRRLGAEIALVVCQKSKIDDWIEHFETYYEYPVIRFNKQTIDELPPSCVLVINYDSVWRRPELLQLTNFSLILDESSHISNESAKRTKFIMKLQATNVILLSGTPTGGKYEQLWTQANLLGWKISKKLFWKQYIITEKVEDEGGFVRHAVVGYKNVDRLKAKLKQHGAVFLKSSDAGIKLPEQVDIPIKVRNTKDYAKFKRHRIITMDGVELVGDTTLKQMLYLRQLAGMYNPGKMAAMKDLLESTSDRVIVFYNFKQEYEQLRELCQLLDRPISVVNGDLKDMSAFNAHSDSVTLIQYKAGAMGLNLQKANKIVYFTPPLESILFEQSKKRTHRDGQTETCFYYYLKTIGSIEEQIYNVLADRRDFTDYLFEELED